MKKTRESPKFPAFFVQTHIVCLGGSGHDIQTRLYILSGKIVRIFLRHTPFLGLCGFLLIIGLLSASTVCATGVANTLDRTIPVAMPSPFKPRVGQNMAPKSRSAARARPT